MEHVGFIEGLRSAEEREECSASPFMLHTANVSWTLTDFW